MFEIYSIGDSAFLASILNAVAMICGTGDFVTLVSIGILLGALLVCVQSVMNGAKDIQWGQILMGWIMYMCMFGPSCTVTIEDAYTGQVRVVDNVPIGVGFAGGMISNIGYGLTELFEVGFSTPARVTEQPFAESLRLLNAVRSRTYDLSVLNAANAALSQNGNVDIAQSLENYIRECTMVKIALRSETKERVYTLPYNEALKFESDVFGTKLYLGNGNEDDAPTCSKAAVLIDKALTSLDQPQVITAINRAIGARDERGTPTDLASVTNALTMLGLTGQDAHHFVKVALIQPIYENAARGFYQNQGDISSALMVNQAITQRNTQWATEQSLFMTTVRPILTFFEGFVFAITPVMAFLMVMGSVGMKLVGRYFQVIIWIQLWMPVMAICNLYIVMAASGQLASITAPFSSFYALNQMSQILETWIATGGMLCAATPMIALFLVTGSTYAFTTLANRMQGQDHVNEKMGTPDLQQVNPYHAQESFQMGNAFQSSLVNGAQNMFKQLGIGDTYSSLATSARTNAHKDMGAFSRELSNSVLSGMTQNEQASFNQSLGESMMSSHSKTYDSIYNKMKDHGWTAGRDAKETQQEVGRIVMGVSAGGGLSLSRGVTKTQTSPFSMGSGAIVPYGTVTPTMTIGRNQIGGASGEVNAQVGADATTQASNATGKSAGYNLKDGESITFSEDEAAQIRDDVAHQVNTGYLKSYAEQMSKSDNATMRKTGSSAIESAKNFTEAQSENETFGSQGSMRSNELASWVGTTKSGQLAMAEARLANRDLSNEAQRRADQLYRATGDTELAQNAAWLETLHKHGRFQSFTNVLEASQGYGALQYNGARDNANMSQASHVQPQSLNRPTELSQATFNDKMIEAKGKTGHPNVEYELGEHHQVSQQHRREFGREMAGRFVSSAMPQAISQLEKVDSHRATDMLNANLSQSNVDYVARHANLSHAQTGLLNAFASQESNRGERIEAARKALFEENKQIFGGEDGKGWSDSQIQNLTNLEANAIYDAAAKGVSKAETAMTGLTMVNSVTNNARKIAAGDIAENLKLNENFKSSLASLNINQELSKQSVRSGFDDR